MDFNLLKKQRYPPCSFCCGAYSSTEMKSSSSAATKAALDEWGGEGGGLRSNTWKTFWLLVIWLLNPLEPFQNIYCGLCIPYSYYTLVVWNTMNRKFQFPCLCTHVTRLWAKQSRCPSNNSLVTDRTYLVGIFTNDKLLGKDALVQVGGYGKGGGGVKFWLVDGLAW